MSALPRLLPGVPFTEEEVPLLGVTLGVRLIGVLLSGVLWEGDGV